MFWLFISLLSNGFLQSEIMQKSDSVQDITSIIEVADKYQVQFVCLWCFIPSYFIVQINNFFSLVVLSTAIHKRRGKKLISKTIELKLVLQRCDLSFFILKTFIFFLKTINFAENLEMTHMAGGGRRGVVDMFFAPLWRNAYENWYAIQTLKSKIRSGTSLTALFSALFLKKIFLTLCSINWKNFIVWFAFISWDVVL